MQKAAVNDNAPIFAKYVKANPDTQFFTVTQSPDEEAVTAWPGEGKYMVAVYPDKDAIKEIKTVNPFVLPLTQNAFDEAQVDEYAIFESEDKAWESVNPGLAVEIGAYNDKIKQAAKEAGVLPKAERPIAYKYDTALGQLLGRVLPQGVGLVGFVLAALLGAVVSSLAAMLNAASTIFSMDIYKKYISPNASQGGLVLLGRICVVVFTGVAVFLAPQLGNPKISNSIFTIIQESQGFLSPGILAVFVFGLLIRRAPAMVGAIGLVTNFIAYGTLKWISTIEAWMSNKWMELLIKNFLNRMAICFAFCLLVMSIITIIKPLAQPIEFKKKTDLNLETSQGAKIAGILIIVLTVILYIIFSPLCIAK
jgi:SSS family solute:Na+ symporter